MKVANQLAQIMEIILNCPGGPSVFTRVHKIEMKTDGKEKQMQSEKHGQSHTG